MRNINEIKLQAIETLTRQAARIDAAAFQLTQITNEFEIEAKVYFIARLAEQAAAAAREIHAEMHEVNSNGSEHHFGGRS